MQVGPLEPLTHDEWSFILNRTIETWSEQPPTLVNTKYQYIPSAYLFVNSGVYLTEGTLYRQSSVYESACTLRIWDWLFTLERMNEDFFEHVHKVRNIGASNPWQVVAIREAYRTRLNIAVESSDPDSLWEIVKHVVWPTIEPAFDSSLDVQRLTWCPAFAEYLTTARKLSGSLDGNELLTVRYVGRKEGDEYGDGSSCDDDDEDDNRQKSK